MTTRGERGEGEKDKKGGRSPDAKRLINQLPTNEKEHANF